MTMENFKQGKVVHGFNPGTQEWEAEAETDGSYDFEAIVIYISSSRTAKTTKRDPVSKINNNSNDDDEDGALLTYWF